MAGSLNKVILVGNVGNDPEVRKTQSGDSVATVSLATSESWKDQSGARQDRTEWHRVVLFGKVADVVSQYVKKGSKLLIEGQVKTRKWQNQQGADVYTTEVVVSGFGGRMVMLDSPSSGGSKQYGADKQSQSYNQNQGFGGATADQKDKTNGGAVEDLDDDIPF